MDETESNIRFALLGQVMLGEAKLSLTSLDLAKLIRCWMRSNLTSVLSYHLGSNQLQTGQCTCNNDKMSQFPCLQVLV